MPKDAAPVCVYKASRVDEAQIVRLALEEAGVKAHILGEQLPYAGIGAVPIEIYVAADQLEAAREIVAGHLASSGEAAERDADGED